MKCDKCGGKIEIGDFPFCPHGRVGQRKPFPSFWDEHVSHEPIYVDSLAKWNRVMKENGMEMRDPLPKGEVTARRDRSEYIRQERRSHE